MYVIWGWVGERARRAGGWVDGWMVSGSGKLVLVSAGTPDSIPSSLCGMPRRILWLRARAENLKLRAWTPTVCTGISGWPLIKGFGR